jgi:hypothetical protein
MVDGSTNLTQARDLLCFLVTFSAHSSAAWMRGPPEPPWLASATPVPMGPRKGEVVPLPIYSLIGRDSGPVTTAH